MRHILLATLMVTTPAFCFAENSALTSERARMADSVVDASNKEIREETITKLNSLLRGEISAVETYRQALTKVSDQPGSSTLKTYMNDHQNAVEVLKGEVLRLNGVPSTDSGAWGAWAQTVQGTANLFGDTAALKALKEGEEHGLKEYTEAIEQSDFSAAVKARIGAEFIKNQRTHIAGLDGFLANVR